jgi:hypothetical protein
VDHSPGACVSACDLEEDLLPPLGERGASDCRVVYSPHLLPWGRVGVFLHRASVALRSRELPERGDGASHQTLLRWRRLQECIDYEFLSLYHVCVELNTSSIVFLITYC